MVKLIDEGQLLKNTNNNWNNISKNIKHFS